MSHTSYMHDSRHETHQEIHQYRPGKQHHYEGPGEYPVLGYFVLGCIGLLLVVSVVQHLQKRQRMAAHADRARGGLQKAAAADNRWRPDLVRKRLNVIFPDIQRALRTGDLSCAAGHMSANGLRGLHGRLDTLAEQGFRFEIDSPRLRHARALFVLDRAADVGDILWMEIGGTRACYEVSLYDGCLREGSHREVRGFTELWKLVHGPAGQWVVDEIVPPGAVDRMMQTLQAMYRTAT